MKIEIYGTYKNAVTEKSGLYLNSISVRRKDGQEMVIDRDETEYGLSNGKADIVFRGAYVWDSDKGTAEYLNNNTGDVALYDGAELTDYDIEDDAPDGYDLQITKGQRIAAW